MENSTSVIIKSYPQIVLNSTTILPSFAEYAYDSYRCLPLAPRKEKSMDFTALTTALSLTAFSAVLEDVLPIVGVAVLVGFLFYVVRWAIGLFRGI